MILKFLQSAVEVELGWDCSTARTYKLNTGPILSGTQTRDLVQVHLSSKTQCIWMRMELEVIFHSFSKQVDIPWPIILAYQRNSSIAYKVGVRADHFNDSSGDRRTSWVRKVEVILPFAVSEVSKQLWASIFNDAEVIELNTHSAQVYIVSDTVYGWGAEIPSSTSHMFKHQAVRHSGSNKKHSHLCTLQHASCKVLLHKVANPIIKIRCISSELWKSEVMQQKLWAVAPTCFLLSLYLMHNRIVKVN